MIKFLCILLIFNISYNRKLLESKFLNLKDTMMIKNKNYNKIRRKNSDFRIYKICKQSDIRENKININIFIKKNIENDNNWYLVPGKFFLTNNCIFSEKDEVPIDYKDIKYRLIYN